MTQAEFTQHVARCLVEDHRSGTCPKRGPWHEATFPATGVKVRIYWNAPDTLAVASKPS